MKIFGKELTKDEILLRIGDIKQLGGIKYYELTDGVSKGIRAVDIKTPAGLDFSILLDRGMDISSMYYKSIPISWKSAVRETSAIYYESKGKEFLRTFFGGLLTTCGLTYAGMPCIDKGEELGQHGRISNLPAENVYSQEMWENDSYKMQIYGKVREVTAFGDKIELSRKITTFMDEPKIILEDTVENIGFTKSPLMILYHINIGYPVLDETSILLEGKSVIKPKDEEAKKGFHEFFKFSKPQSNFKQQIYYHNISSDSEGNSNIAIVNKNFNNGQGIGLAVKFNKDNLPYLIQWKYTGMGEYVCGIEPSNSLIRGRDIERQEGKLIFIKPREKINYRLELDILSSNEDINNYKGKYC